MKSQFDVIIIGNNMAALATALELSKQDCSIALLNSSSNWGGHFSGIQYQNTNFDFGMNFLEFTSFNTNTNSDDVISYDTFTKNDVGRFLHLVKKFVSDHIEYSETSTPQLYWTGKYFNDLFISNNFDVLKHLSASIREKIKTELQLITTQKNELHPSQKSVNEIPFVTNTYKHVSIKNHGETFHNLFIEPFFKKITNLDTQLIPSLFHRIAWMPLFYPETILSQFSSNPQVLSPTIFSYPKKGYFSFLTKTITEKIQNTCSICILKDTIKFIDAKAKHIIFDNFDITGKNIIWTIDNTQFLKLSEGKELNFLPDKASISIAFVEIDTKQLNKFFSTLNILDTDILPYRITNQTFAANLSCASSTKIVIEVNTEILFKFYDISNTTWVIECLLQLQIIKTAQAVITFNVKHLRNALNIPTINNYNFFQKNIDYCAKNYSDIFFIGQSSGFTSNSLNDQIVQAIKTAKLLKFNSI